VSESYELLELDWITLGAVGQPGHRLFFLQAGQGPSVVTLKLEKVQVAAMVTWIARTLEDLPAPGPLPSQITPEPFLDPEWVVGSLGGGYDIDTDRVLLIATELTESSSDDDLPDDILDDSGAVARLGATREQMAALAIQGTSLIASGRPPCPLCGYPLDPSGHACPRTNGHRPPSL